jgi:hypothetical protein
MVHEQTIMNTVLRNIQESGKTQGKDCRHTGFSVTIKAGLKAISYQLLYARITKTGKM